MTPFEIPPTHNARLFFASLAFGAAFGLYYEFFRFLRRAFPAPVWIVAIQDFLFWLPVAPTAVLFTYALSDGVLRWFSVAAALAGFAVYRLTLGRLICRFYSAVIDAVRRALAALSAPVRKIFNKISVGVLQRIKKFVILKKEKKKRAAAKRKAREGGPDGEKSWTFCGLRSDPGHSGDPHRGPQRQTSRTG